MPYLAQASSASVGIDRVFLASVGICGAVLLLITFFIIYFCIRYSRARNSEPVDIEGATWLEVTWTVVPLILFLVMFYFGWTNYRILKNAPADALVVQVTARQWAWSFKYPNGKQSTELYAALGRPVKLITHTVDVIHGFYVPAFRIKTDVVPGKENTVWFTPRLLGDFDIQCTVICGVSHSAMLSKVRVIPEEDFKRWYFGGDSAPTPGPADVSAVAGETGAVALLRAKACLACHSLDGRPMVGPTFKGVFGSKQRVHVGGEEREIKVDEAFLRNVIAQPDAQLVAGYPPIMPQASLEAKEIDEIVSYIRSLGATAP